MLECSIEAHKQAFQSSPTLFKPINHYITPQEICQVFKPLFSSIFHTNPPQPSPPTVEQLNTPTQPFSFQHTFRWTPTTQGLTVEPQVGWLSGLGVQPRP
jgi:hypothetical protein